MSLLQAQLPQGTVNLCSPAKRFRVHTLGHPFAVARSAPDAAPWQYRRRAWTALSSASRARQQIDTHVRHVARVLSESGFPLTANVLRQMKGLSGADLRVGGRRRAIKRRHFLPIPPHFLHGTPSRMIGRTSISARDPAIGGQTYLCCGLQLTYPRSDPRGHAVHSLSGVPLARCPLAGDSALPVARQFCQFRRDRAGLGRGVAP